MPWLTSKKGDVKVLVDEDIYDQIAHLEWTPDKRGCLKRPGFVIKRNDYGRKTVVQRINVYVHQLVTSAEPGQNVHHKNGLWDCRRESLKLYDSYEEHWTTEHACQKQ